MANTYFRFKEFTIHQDRCAMKVTTDACLFGAWCAETLSLDYNTSDNPKTLLDAGAGSGLLSLMVANKTKVLVDAVEVDAAAAGQAKENAAASPWRERITVVHANVLQWHPAHQYDCIVSNPPFYENDLKSPKARKNLAHHDEGLPLAGLFLFVKKQLKKNGSFFLLLPAKRADEALRLLQENGFHLYKKTLVKQTPDHPPFRVMMQAGKTEKPERPETVITIKSGGQEYSPEFVSLLKPYYLRL